MCFVPVIPKNILGTLQMALMSVNRIITFEVAFLSVPRIFLGIMGTKIHDSIAHIYAVFDRKMSGKGKAAPAKKRKQEPIPQKPEPAKVSPKEGGKPSKKSKKDVPQEDREMLEVFKRSLEKSGDEAPAAAPRKAKKQKRRLVLSEEEEEEDEQSDDVSVEAPAASLPSNPDRRKVMKISSSTPPSSGKSSKQPAAQRALTRTCNFVSIFCRRG